MENEMMMQEAPEQAGRGTDTVMAHMSLGEVVIPREFLSDPQVMEMLQMLFQSSGADMAEFTVGDPSNKINPETGYPEFGFFKSLGKIAKVAAPLALSYFAPSIGTALGEGILGAGATGSSTLGSALVGGGLSKLTGGNALQGAVLGGIGANLGNVGSVENPGSGILGAVGKNIPGVYDLASGLSSAGSGISNALGSLPSSAQGPTQSGASLGSGSGALGKLGNALGVGSAPKASSGLSSALTSGAGGGSTFGGLNAAANIFGGLNQNAAIKKQQKQLLGANQQQLANLETFDPSNITNDAGYQFNLQQGQEGLNRGLAAGGALYSGKALKAASEYNQNYANNAFNAAYQRWLQKVQGQNAIYGNTGDVLAQATGAGAQNLNQSLSNALGAPVGQYGQNSQLELLKRLGIA